MACMVTVRVRSAGYVLLCAVLLTAADAVPMSTAEGRVSPKGGGLDRVLFLLPGYERLATGAARTWAADLHFCAVDAQVDPLCIGVGEHVFQGPQPDAGPVGHGEPAGCQQRPHLPDRTRDGGTI